jgi:hypothetical protein
VVGNLGVERGGAGRIGEGEGQQTICRFCGYVCTMSVSACGLACEFQDVSVEVLFCIYIQTHSRSIHHSFMVASCIESENSRDVMVPPSGLLLSSPASPKNTQTKLYTASSLRPRHFKRKDTSPARSEQPLPYEYDPCAQLFLPSF